MSVPTREALAITRGDDWTVELHFPGDVSAWTAHQAMVRETSASTVHTDFTVDTSAATSGLIRISLTAALTRTLPAFGVWDAQATIGGKVTTIAAGSLAVTDDVTH